MPDIKLGSLFDGIGVFPLAASRCGIRPVWASEIEKAPISITKRHFPDMVHLGDITKVDGGKIPPVHIITFGSPCQNLSLIGNRSGLAGAKSSLFYQAFRIIQEMRDATDNLTSGHDDPKRRRCGRLFLYPKPSNKQNGGTYMEFFNQAIDILKILVMALGAGLAVWGVINLLEGYGSDNPAAKSQGIKQLMAGGGVVLIGLQLIPLLSGLFS